MFDSFDIKYTDGLELDGAFSVSHINYGCSPKFHGEDANDIAKSSRKNSITFKDKIDDVLDSIRKFNGTEKNYKIADRIYLWKKYWFDYIEAFDKSTKVMPDSVVTVYIGRHAIELGLKYLIMVKKGSVVKSHGLKKLYDEFDSVYKIQEQYMEWMDLFCELYCKYIEEDNPEHFRFSEYKGNTNFAGNRLDIRWLCYNLSLIILKLLHFSGLEDEYNNN